MSAVGRLRNGSAATDSMEGGGRKGEGGRQCLRKNGRRGAVIRVCRTHLGEKVLTWSAGEKTQKTLRPRLSNLTSQKFLILDPH